MQDTFERFLPKLQKTLQLGEIWIEVVVLPANFAVAKDGPAAGTHDSPWLGRTPQLASENLAWSGESQVLMV
jgi:hypothetical protein